MTTRACPTSGFTFFMSHVDHSTKAAHEHLLQEPGPGALGEAKKKTTAVMTDICPASAKKTLASAAGHSLGHKLKMVGDREVWRESQPQCAPPTHPQHWDIFPK